MLVPTTLVAVLVGRLGFAVVGLLNSEARHQVKAAQWNAPVTRGEMLERFMNWPVWKLSIRAVLSALKTGSER